MFPGLVLGLPISKLTTTSQNVAHTLKVFGLQIQISWNLLFFQPTWHFCQITHMCLWLLSLSCCPEDMVQQPWATHPDGSKCQPVAQCYTDLMCLQWFRWGCVVSTWIEGLTGQSIPKSSWQQPSGNQQQTTHPIIGRNVATAPMLKPTNHAIHHGLCSVLCNNCEVACPTIQ